MNEQVDVDERDEEYARILCPRCWRECVGRTISSVQPVQIATSAYASRVVSARMQTETVWMCPVCPNTMGHLVRHLPGKHDQMTHGRKYGSSKMTKDASFEQLSLQEKHHHMAQQSEEWRSKLKKTQQEALKTYTGGSYEKINTALRNKQEETLSASLQKTVKNANAALHQGDLTEPIVVHRGLKNSSGERWDFFQKQVGKTFVDPAFGSSSLNPQVAKNFQSGSKQGIIIEIHAPKGSSGGYIQPLSKYPTEYEYLFPASTRYKVISATIDESGQRRVVLGAANR